MALKLKKIDTTKNAEARWERYDEDTEVLLMPIDNEQYQIALERMRRQLARNDAAFSEDQVGVVPGERSEHDKHCLLLAQFIIQDWKGAVDDSGAALSYEEAVGAEMLRGDVQFFLFTLRRARAIASDYAAEREEVLGKQ